MAFPNVSDLVATTIESRTKEVADNVTNHNGLLAKLKSEGGVKTFSGGPVILEEIAFAENGNAGWYSGYDLLPTSAQDVISAAQFTIKQLAVPVSISGLETLINSGREAFIDLLDSRLSVAEMTLKNRLSVGLYADGTGSSGKTLTGLGAAISTTPNSGVYGGIDKSVWSFWRNQKSKGGGVDYAGTLSTSNVGAVFTSQWVKQVRGGDKPNLIVADQNFYSIYVNSLQPQQRFMDTKMAGLGFDSVMFMSAPVILETTSSGIAANTAYFLNTEYIRLRPHAQRNIVTLDPGKRVSVNQDANVQMMAWAGNLTCRGLFVQGIVQN